MTHPLRVSLIGVTGYTGLETLRLLSAHPHVTLSHLVSHSHAGQPLGSIVPSLSHLDHTLRAYDAAQLVADSDVVILAVPHGVSPQYVPDLIGQVKLIDLAGDFRLQDLRHFEQYYGHAHPCPQHIPAFVYGLPEVNRQAITTADNVANCGCFASALQIAAFPFRGQIQHLSAVGVTGSSGSGKAAKATTHHPIRSHNLSSYKIGHHQHTPELLQSCDLIAQQVSFIPTSGPFVRGIMVTAVLETTSEITVTTATQLVRDTYTDSPTIRVVPSAQIAHVVGSAYVDVSVSAAGGRLVVQVVIDNLMKGCASTAIQNLNLMHGLPEMTGLDTLLPLYP